MAHQALQNWVQEIAQVTKPNRIHWCDGSEDEINALYEMMVADGTLTKLDDKKHPNSYLARSDINDVARVEGRTFICSATKDEAGPTNNWMDPAEMHAVVDPLFEGCMQGRVMYVIPYLMGPAGSDLSKVGIENHRQPLRRCQHADHDSHGTNRSR